MNYLNLKGQVRKSIGVVHNHHIPFHVELFHLEDLSLVVSPQDLGETYPVSPCPDCGEKTYYHLVKTEDSRRISLPAVGSVPIPTTETTRFRLVCPHCNNSIKVDGTDIQEAKVMLESTQQYIDDEISDEKYGKRMQRFHEVLEDV